MSGEPRVAIYGRTYLDAEVAVPLATLAEGKGKVDVTVAAVLGGFGCNAARALVGRLPAGSVRLVTVSSWLDWPRLRASLPDEVVLDALLDAPASGTAPWPEISVIVNPAGECRLLRGRAEGDAAHWRVDRIASGALAARLHVLGRLPPAFVAALARPDARAPGSRLAWCGGDALPRALEVAFDVMLVNAAEAGRLLGTTSGAPAELARELAARARAPGAIRVVTGRGQAPAGAAVRESGGRVRCHEGARVTAIPKARVRRFKGVGDVFAARFLAEACFDARGAWRRRPEVAGALAAAQQAATRFITSVERP